MTIELRLTEVDPPTDEPHRTIYHDIASLPDPVIQGLTIRYFNHDDVDLYFKITGSGTGYTFTPVNLGLLATGANAYKNLDNFVSRAKPSIEMGENITLILTAYTDAGYTNLKWTFERVVQVIWINSADPSYTLDESDNFDDGTVQGWAAVQDEVNKAAISSFGVATDYVLSTPYSLKCSFFAYYPYEARVRIYKSFTTPNKDRIYAIIDVRIDKNASAPQVWLKNLQIKQDTTILVFIGRPFDTAAALYTPIAKWIRIVVPLPKSTTLELRVVHSHARLGAGGSDYGYVWLDDFKIISK
jgi:hypothetical protein